MSNLGIPIEHFVDSVVASYLRGFEDAITYLTSAHKSFDIEQMKQKLMKDIKEKNDIDAKW